MRIERVDEAVLRTLGGDVLHPAVIMAVLDGVIEAMSPPTLARDVEDLRADLRTLERELLHLTDAIAAGGDLGSLLDGLKARQTRRDELTAALAARESFDDDLGITRAGNTHVRVVFRVSVAGCPYGPLWRARSTASMRV